LELTNAQTLAGEYFKHVYFEWNALTRIVTQMSRRMEVYYVLSLKTFYILKVQEVIPISSYDTGGTLLLLGCHNGSIYYIGKIDTNYFKFKYSFIV
jgi:hypothetical protein